MGSGKGEVVFCGEVGKEDRLGVVSVIVTAPQR